MNILGTILALALLAVGQPSAKPNFSGEWKMNASKSNFGALPPPTSITRSITHAEPSLSIVEQQVSDLGNQNATRTYKTDGSEASFTASGADVKGKATWSDNTLVMVSSVDAIGLTFTDRMSLSTDSRTLTSVIHVAAPQGELDLTIVFDRQ
jgi:hypothetical protein